MNNAQYNGGRVPSNSVTNFGNAYSRRHISFGDGLINDQDSHREDTVSSSGLPAAERRIGLDKQGEKNVNFVVQPPNTEAWRKRIEKAQIEDMKITKKPDHAVGGAYVFEVLISYILIKVRAHYLILQVLGNKGRSYAVTIARNSICECPDSSKAKTNRICKHCLFVLLKLGLADSHLLYQVAFTQVSLPRLFNHPTSP